MTVGQRIVEARKDQGMTRPGLSKASGVPYPTLAGLESGDQATSTAIPALAAVLGVTALWLATGDGPKRTPITPSQSMGIDRDSLRGALHSVRRLADTFSLEYGSGDEIGAIVRAYDHLAAGEPQDDLLSVILGYVDEHGGSFNVRRGEDGTVGIGTGSPARAAAGKAKR